MRTKIQNLMSKEAAMNLLGLSLSTEGKKKKPKQITDYSEGELLDAFRETCSLIGERFVANMQLLST